MLVGVGEGVGGDAVVDEVFVHDHHSRLLRLLDRRVSLPRAHHVCHLKNRNEFDEFVF